MIPRPVDCDGNACDYEVIDGRAVWVHVDCGVAPGRGASEIRHPAMSPARRYLNANPLPGQQDRRAS